MSKTLKKKTTRKKTTRKKTTRKKTTRKKTNKSQFGGEDNNINHLCPICNNQVILELNTNNTAGNIPVKYTPDINNPDSYAYYHSDCVNNCLFSQLKIGLMCDNNSLNKEIGRYEFLGIHKTFVENEQEKQVLFEQKYNYNNKNIISILKTIQNALPKKWQYFLGSHKPIYLDTYTANIEMRIKTIENAK